MVDSLKCFNLERIINVMEQGKELPDDIDMDEYLMGIEDSLGTIEIDD